MHELRRDLILLRKTIAPVRDSIAQLGRTRTDLVSKDTRLYLADAFDHAVQVLDSVDALREVAASVRDLHLSALNTRMNEVMKVLTLISTIFIPLGFLAGLYGMNFDVMPELHVAWGYPALLGVMLATVTTMLLFFRRKQWI